MHAVDYEAELTAFELSGIERSPGQVLVTYGGVSSSFTHGFRSLALTAVAAGFDQWPADAFHAADIVIDVLGWVEAFVVGHGGLELLKAASREGT